MSTSRCRVCLSENDCIHNIFSEKCSNGQSYAEVLMSCIDGITIIESDMISSRICKACVSKLESCIVCGVIDDEFVSKYFSSDQLSKNTIVKVEPKEECQQIQQVEASADVMADIKIEEIHLKMEPDAECIQIESNETDSSQTSPAMPDLCEKSFSRTSSKRKTKIQHLQPHTNENVNVFVCDQCGVDFYTRHKLIKHLWKHSARKLPQCNYCNKEFCTFKDLTQHKKTCTNKKKYKCNFCDFQFPKKSHLTRHLKKYAGQYPKCEHCGLTFCSILVLRKHLHTHVIEKPYECDQCGIVFSFKYSLTLHLRTHNIENPYKCNECKKAFTTKPGLTRHLRTKAHKVVSECIQSIPGIPLAKHFLLDQPPRSEKKYAEYTTEIVKRTDIETEEIWLKTEPDEKYFLTDLEENEMDLLEMKE